MIPTSYLVFVVTFCLGGVTCQLDSFTLPGFSSSTWPNGEVPYQIDASFSPIIQKRIQDAIASLNNEWFCVTFRPKTPTDNDYISFVPTNGNCYSQSIGYAGGMQSILLSQNCSTPRYIYWVLLQALGLPAEHQRPDRDDYITINWGNIQSGYEDAFKRYAFIDSRILAVPYDLYSRIHYPNTRFANKDNEFTIVAKQDPNILLGNVLSPTLLDYRKLAALYCANGTFPTPTTPVPNNGPTPTGQPMTTQTPMTPAADSTTMEATVAPVTGNSGFTVTTAKPAPGQRPGGVPAYLALARQLGQAPPTQKAQQYCKCLSKPNAKGSCEDSTTGFQWQGMAQQCLQHSANMSNPVCSCEDTSTNPCWCEPSTTTPKTCVKKCRTPVGRKALIQALALNTGVNAGTTVGSKSTTKKERSHGFVNRHTTSAGY